MAACDGHRSLVRLVMHEPMAKSPNEHDTATGMMPYLFKMYRRVPVTLVLPMHGIHKVCTRYLVLVY